MKKNCLCNWVSVKRGKTSRGGKQHMCEELERRKILVHCLLIGFIAALYNSPD